MTLFDIVAKITLDDKGFKDGVKGAEESGKSLGLKLGSVLGTAAKVGGAAIGAAATGLSALTGMSVKSFAEYEQLAGGVETLFKNSSNIVMQYADNAYKTAGLSANEYMETVTSFSASLLQSLGGDTEKAAQVADMAITDMSDNANKMGTSMESIQNAYQGFAKQNYTMLDNLKLGYGGTKQEMERLLQDAEKFSGVKYDINNLNDVYEAIHVIQTELDITGTTSKEASETISGSTAAMKSAFKNLVTGLTNGDANLGALIDNFVASAETMAKNVVPAVSRALKGIGKLVQGVAPVIINELPALINDLLPELISAATALVGSLVQALPNILSALQSVIPVLIDAFMQAAPMLIDAGIQILLALVNGITENLPTLIPAAVGAIIQITEALIDNVDLLIDGAIALIIGLANGLIEATPRLIEKAPEIVLKLVTAIIQNAPKLVTAAIELIGSLARGIVNALGAIAQVAKDTVSKFVDGVKSWFSKLLSLGKEVVDSVKNGIKSKISDAATWGKDLLNNFINGIKSKIQSLKNAVSNVAQTVRNFLHFTEPDEGPLADFHTYSPDMIDLFIEGMKKNQRRLRNAVADTFDFREDMNLTPSFAVSGASATYSGGGFVDSLTNNLVEAMANMRIYLDSGEMVGAMTPALDRSLGVEITHRGRAN